MEKIVNVVAKKICRHGLAGYCEACELEEVKSFLQLSDPLEIASKYREEIETAEIEIHNSSSLVNLGGMPAIPPKQDSWVKSFHEHIYYHYSCLKSTSMVIEDAERSSLLKKLEELNTSLIFEHVEDCFGCNKKVEKFYCSNCIEYYSNARFLSMNLSKLMIDLSRLLSAVLPLEFTYIYSSNILAVCDIRKMARAEKIGKQRNR